MRRGRAQGSAESAATRLAVVSALRQAPPWYAVYPLIDFFTAHGGGETKDECRRTLKALDEALEVLYLPEDHPDSGWASKAWARARSRRAL